MLIYKETKEILKKVHKEGNKIRWTPDIEVWGVDDKWDYPVEFKGKLSEDCDGISLWKYRELLNKGISKEYLTMIICTTETGEGHMVLGVITDLGVMILDNRQTWIEHWKDLKRNGYVFLYRSTPGKSFDSMWQIIK